MNYFRLLDPIRQNRVQQGRMRRRRPSSNETPAPAGAYWDMDVPVPIVLSTGQAARHEF